jgi:hypothetical protein
MRFVLRLLAPLFLLACGSRSGLEVFATASDAGPAVDTGVQPASPWCTSALAPGSPAPIAGYCSTQSNLSPTRLPSHPHGTWSLTLFPDAPRNSDFQAIAQILVGADGTAYVASCGSTSDDTFHRCTLAAITPDGTIAWSQDLAARSPFLGADGKLHVATGGTTWTLLSFDTDGTMTQLGVLPDNVTYSFVGSDGSLYGSSVDYTTMAADRVVKMTPDGQVVWSTALPCHDCINSMALSPDDGMVVALDITDGMGGLSGRMVRLDASGNVAWTRDLAGSSADSVAVARDGSIRIALWLNSMTSIPSSRALAAIDPAGELLWQADVHQDPEQSGLDALVVRNDGTTVFRSFTHMNAIDASGHVLWSQRLDCPNCVYAAAADPGGGLVALRGSVQGIDPATGDMLWSGVEPPQTGTTDYFDSAMVTGTPGVVYGATFGGVIFAASDR